MLPSAGPPAVGPLKVLRFFPSFPSCTFLSLNPVYLSRLFKLDTGKTLSEYLNCYRTECSLALLTDTADTIQSISQKVGYSDVRSYIRFFKKYYDVTPSEYRRGAVGK